MESGVGEGVGKGGLKRREKGGTENVKGKEQYLKVGSFLAWSCVIGAIGDTRPLLMADFASSLNRL